MVNGWALLRVDDIGIGRKRCTSTTTGVADGIWRHVVGVIDKTADLLRLYINGVQRIELTGTAMRSEAESTKSIGMTLGPHESTLEVEWHQELTYLRLKLSSPSAYVGVLTIPEGSIGANNERYRTEVDERGGSTAIDVLRIGVDEVHCHQITSFLRLSSPHQIIQVKSPLPMSKGVKSPQPLPTKFS